MSELKGQAALDFLMTYGWAILLIIIIIGALFALGIFDINTLMGSRAVGFTQIGVAAWRVDGSGVLTAQFTNHVGTDVRIDSVKWTYRGTDTINSSVATSIANGATTSTLTLGAVPGITTGTSYSMAMVISYVDLSTNFTYSSGGTLTGKSG